MTRIVTYALILPECIDFYYFGYDLYCKLSLFKFLCEKKIKKAKTSTVIPIRQELKNDFSLVTAKSDKILKLFKTNSSSELINSNFYII